MTSPLVTWNTTTIDGREWLVVNMSRLMVPLDWDPSSQMFFAVAVPDGGYANLPILLSGEDGATPDIDAVIDLTTLTWDDPTPASASFTELSPGVYQMNLTLHEGEPGNDGTMTLDPDDYGTPVSGYLLKVKADLTGFEYISPRIGDRYFPAVLNSVPSGNAGYTMGTVSIAAQAFDWRPECHGSGTIVGTGTDVQVDLVARLQVGATSAETSGNIVGRGRAAAGQNPPPVTLIPGLHPGTYPPTADFDKVPAGSTAVIYFRSERQSGGDTYTVSSSTESFWMKVCPIP